MKYTITAEFLHKNENKSATKISSSVVHLFTKQGMPSIDREVIKACLIATAEENVVKMYLFIFLLYKYLHNILDFISWPVKPKIFIT